MTRNSQRLNDVFDSYLYLCNLFEIPYSIFTSQDKTEEGECEVISTKIKGKDEVKHNLKLLENDRGNISAVQEDNAEG